MKELTKAALLLLGFAALPAVGNAQVITKVPGTVQVTSGLTAFTTLADQMTGMTVTTGFTDGTSETALWATTAIGAGAATGSAFTLTASGDTFSANWTLTALKSGLNTLSIDAGTGSTVFDTTNPSPGTPGSSSGRDFIIVGGTGNVNAAATVATYSNVVALTGANPVGDLYRLLSVSFAGSLAKNSTLVYQQDTDSLKYQNDIRPAVPEPGSFALLTGFAIAGAGFLSRRRRQQARSAA